jgi:uncharacterized protein (TIGR02646 family)
MIRFSRGAAPTCLALVTKTAWPPAPTCYAVVRRELFETTKQHCAFCDGAVGAESTCTVEHFRPKRDFPNLIFDWTNLFPACNACQAAKGKKFDERLLKPDSFDYRFARYFICNFLTGEIESNPIAPASDQEQAKLTIQIYDLNKTERKRRRLQSRKYWDNRENGQDLDDFNYRYFLVDRDTY